MKKIFHLILLSGVLITGCIGAGNRQLDSEISHFNEAISWVNYMGSKDGFHFIKGNPMSGVYMYRILESDLKIDDPFPLTFDKNKWRPMKKNPAFRKAPKKILYPIAPRPPTPKLEKDSQQTDARVPSAECQAP